MKLLLDTHLLLWMALTPARVPPAVQALVSSDDTVLFFSPASLWEIAIKQGLGRADFQVNARVLRRGLLDNGYIELPIRSDHAVAIDCLPPVHKDPFDLLLVAQATVEGLTLLTSDSLVAQYPGPVRLV